MKDAINNGNVVTLKTRPITALDTYEGDFEIPDDVVRRFAESMGWTCRSDQQVHNTANGR